MWEFGGIAVSAASPLAARQSGSPAAAHSSLPAVHLSSLPAAANPSPPATHQSSSRAAAPSSLPAVPKSSPPAAAPSSPPAAAHFSSKVRSSVLTKSQVQAPAPDQESSEGSSPSSTPSQVMSPEVFSTGIFVISLVGFVCWCSSEAGSFSFHGHGGHSQAACFSCCLDGSGS